MVWRIEASDVVFICLLPAFFPRLNASPSFFLFFSSQVDYKSYLLDFKSLPLKDEADEDGSGSGGVTEDSGNFFPQILFLPHRLIHYFFFLSRCFKRKGARSWEPNAWWTPYNGIFRNVRGPDYPVSSLKTKKWYIKYTVRLLSGFVFFLGSSTYMTTAASVLGDERMNECC